MNKKTTLKDSLILKPKLEVKKSDINLSATEKAVANIHAAEVPTPKAADIKPATEEPTVQATVAETTQEVPVKTAISKKTAKTPPPPKEEERTKRVTLDIPVSLHTEIKFKTFRQSITIREYLLGLAEKDLKGK